MGALTTQTVCRIRKSTSGTLSPTPSPLLLTSMIALYFIHSLCIVALGSFHTIRIPLCVIYSASFTLHHLLCIIYSASFTLHHLLCTIYSAPFTLHNLLCIMRKAKKSTQRMRAKREGSCMERDLPHHSLCICFFWRQWKTEISRPSQIDPSIHQVLIRRR